MPKEKKSTDAFDDGIVQLKDISVWREDAKQIYLKEKLEDKDQDEYPPMKEKTVEEGEEVPAPKTHKLSENVSLYRGDITKLKIDAIVNAANKSLLGGGGVDGCIHRAAGPKLLLACRQLNGCNTGDAKITPGYDLPAKHIIHTVGPIARGSCDERLKRQLRNCYEASLKLLETQGLKSIAFPCISTGIYGFPQDDAAEIAVSTVKEWLTEKQALVDRIIFCVFLESDHKIYKEKMLHHFPIDDEDMHENSPLTKKYRSKELSEKSDDKIEVSTEETPDGQAENSLKKKEDEKCTGSPLPLESQDDDSKPSDVYMDSQIEDQSEDNEMPTQPCSQTEGVEMDNSQAQSEGTQKMSDDEENSPTQGEDKENNEHIPYIDDCEDESGQ
ncbi:ADP-ribose glycohydrolase MACROD1-like isoform X2 [Chiloscyllium plagiosum]|uniref:ADP-ribose glycohydrolase MACROD1-like isoform X2 n=1 Tax=Chiloscyllium plagiosum TaxID=36176 RepID=UPI001CB80F18|nr:ADP-ribose glycohydrolase MACROD1-like isoform X2 [Chiloscyllium plagiosum]